MGFADLKGGIGGQHVGFMQVEEVVIFDERFRIFFLVEEGFAALHDDVWVVVLFDRIAKEDLLVGAAQGFLRIVLGLGRARTGCDDTEYDAQRPKASAILEVESGGGNGTYHMRLLKFSKNPG